MQKRLFSHDPEMGITQWFIPSSDGKEFTIQTTQEVGGFLESNKSQFSSFDERANWKGNFHKVATIPLDIFFRLKKQGIATDTAKFKRWLNDPDNRYFRTRPGRV